MVWPTSRQQRLAQRCAARFSAKPTSRVNRIDAILTACDRPFREFVLEDVWGRIWTRPGLAVRACDMLCFAMLAVVGDQDELRLHVRAMRNTAVSEAEIVERLLQGLA